MFQDLLKKAGVSKNAIDTLNDQEIDKMEQLADFTYADFIGMGVRAGSARILANKFGKKEVASQIENPVLAQKVELFVPKKIHELSILELLEKIVNGEDNEEIWQALTAKYPISTFNEKRLNWLIINAEGKIDATATDKYVTYLKGGGNPQVKFGGGRIINYSTLQKGIEVTAYPFERGRVITAGLDYIGKSWLKISDTLKLAIIWARDFNHADFPRNIEPSRHFAEINVPEDELPEPWLTILKDYREAVLSGDKNAKSITLEVPLPVMKNKNIPFAGAEEVSYKSSNLDYTKRANITPSQVAAINRFLENAKLGEAINYFMAITEVNDNVYNTLVLLKSRYNGNEEEYHGGRVSVENYNRTKSQIIYAVQQLI